ncbi:hypothetical protein [Paenibacillus oralis]|uniref:hypothetical protein n=1 Tax=Paenibacillus oralis TaxID=2490856 RepID=UPI0015AB4488|nr:hypothetical protein [Paenibacillus oralis]
MKHPHIVERALREFINELQFRIETEPEAPDIQNVKNDLAMAEEELSEVLKIKEAGSAK